MVKDQNESSRNVAAMRQHHYNASVVSIVRPTDDLMVARVRPDCGIPEFQAGQYTVLGLGSWEPRLANAQPEPEPPPQPLIKRAYSISCAMLEGCEVVRAKDRPYHEFYIALVREATRRPPALTPRLFLLEPGDRLFCGRKPHGHHTLEQVARDDTVIFAATGVGEAPHNAMIADLLSLGHRGEIRSVVCVRHGADLVYQATHRELERRYASYRYLTLTTREPENLDPAAADYVGKRYLQDFFASGEFEHDAKIELRSTGTHVFLCGAPEMIGAPHHTHDPQRRYSSSTGMVEVLESRGFEIDRPHEPGNIHFERFW